MATIFENRSLHAGATVHTGLTAAIPVSTLNDCPIERAAFLHENPDFAERFIKASTIVPDATPFLSFFEEVDERAGRIERIELGAYMTRRGITAKPDTYARLVAFTSALHYHLDYFGDRRGKPAQTELLMAAMRYDRNLTLDDYFNRGAIRCAEAGLLFQLYAQHIGLPSMVLGGTVCFQPAVGKTGLHSLNVIQDEHGLFMVDTINPGIKGRGTYRPRLYALNEAAFTGWLDLATTESALLQLEEQHAPIKPNYEMFGNLPAGTETIKGLRILTIMASQPPVCPKRSKDFGLKALVSATTRRVAGGLHL